MIEFAGIRSAERFVVVEHYPQRKIPKRKYLVQTVPGRSGDLYIEESDDAFENYEDQYTVFLDAKAPGLQQVSRGLAEWLLSSPGYQRREDSYDPDTFRMAVYTGGEEFVNIFNEYGRGTLTFNCNPKRFYKIGEKEIEISTKNTVIYSPSLFVSHPIVSIGTTGTGGGDRVTAEVYVTNTDVSQYPVWSTGVTYAKNDRVRYNNKLYKCLQAHTSQASKAPDVDTDPKLWSVISKTFRMEQVFGTITVDSERHTAVNAGGTNYNSYVKSDYESLYLSPESSISWNNRVTSVTITPRWWTI